MKSGRIKIPENTIINEKYKILSIIGSGGIGTTYKTQNIDNDKIVVLKAMDMEQMESFKELELFEREIATYKED